MGIEHDPLSDYSLFLSWVLQFDPLFMIIRLVIKEGTRIYDNWFLSCLFVNKIWISTQKLYQFLNSLKMVETRSWWIYKWIFVYSYFLVSFIFYLCLCTLNITIIIGGITIIFFLAKVIALIASIPNTLSD